MEGVVYKCQVKEISSSTDPPLLPHLNCSFITGGVVPAPEDNNGGMHGADQEGTLPAAVYGRRCGPSRPWRPFRQLSQVVNYMDGKWMPIREEPRECMPFVFSAGACALGLRHTSASPLSGYLAAACLVGSKPWWVDAFLIIWKKYLPFSVETETSYLASNKF